MRKTLFVLILAAFPALAQNTDIESLSGLQFNFGNPGARSLGMGARFSAWRTTPRPRKRTRPV